MKKTLLFGLLLLGIYAAYVWLMKKRKERNLTFENPVVPRDQTQDVIRTPVFAMNGKQPWLNANLNPMYDTIASIPVVGQFLPKLFGQTTGAIPTTRNSATDVSGVYVESNVRNPETESFSI